ncbi:unnamed protein product [Lota lota]
MSCQQGMLYWKMIKLFVLLLVFSGVLYSCDIPGSPTEMYTDMKCLHIAEGEGLQIVPDGLKGVDKDKHPLNMVTWQHEQVAISSSEEERIHHHGPALLFLPVSVNDSGLYIARLTVSGKCHIFHVPVSVELAEINSHYIPTEVSDSNPRITCPDIVVDTCKDFKGVLSWDRNSSLIAGENNRVLRLLGATKADNALYTCRCTWSHNMTLYNTTASQELKIKGQNFQTLKMRSEESGPCCGRPTASGSSPGFPLSIKCKSLFGTNVYTECNVAWEKNNHSVSGMDGYSEVFSSNTEEPSKKSFCSSTLIIDKVQESDLKASFRCRAKNLVETEYHTLTLKAAESLTNLVVAMICVSAVFLLATTAIKYFAVDLVLFSRRFLPCTKARNDGSQYDVYVVWHSQKESKATEEILNKFLYRALPRVLEQKCGYRVFIHGRDDIPGEDRLKQVEGRVKLSRRLMVVLTPGSEVNKTLGYSPSSPAGVAVDWQIGLHYALLQEIRVILVQLGDMGPQGYTHLSPTLQHLVRKCAPLCWRKDSPDATHWNSRFWKRVRYAMPTASDKPSSSSVV